MGSQWVGGSGSEDDKGSDEQWEDDWWKEVGYRENSQGSEEGSKEHSKENNLGMMRFIWEELGDTISLVRGRFNCRVRGIHGLTCRGNLKCVHWRLFGDDGNADH